MRAILLFLLAALCAVPAQAKIWKIDYATSKLTFAGTQTGKPFTGNFGSFIAQVDFDPENPKNSSIEVTIDMTTAKTGDKQRDTALPQETWFSTALYPHASFVSHDVTKIDETHYVAKGKLTIKKSTQDVVLPFTLASDRDGKRAKGEVAIDRSKFEVGTGEWVSEEWVAHKVTIGVDLMGY